MKKVMIYAILALAFLLASCKGTGAARGAGTSPSPIWMVSTFAGSGAAGFADSDDAALARFTYPFDVAVDSSGNVYVSDYHNHRIRKITQAGVVSTFAGTGAAGFADNEDAALARFNYPIGLAVDSSDNVYVADKNNHRIRKITQEGVVSTIAGNGGRSFADNDDPLQAYFNNPSGVAVDSSGNVYVADYQNNRIRKITPGGGVSTFAGTGAAAHRDGDAAQAQFYYPYGIAVDSDDNVYVADYSNHRIRKITQEGVVSTIAGSGAAGFADNEDAALARFNYPRGVAVDSDGNVYVGDGDNQRIRKITPEGEVSTFAGSGARAFADSDVDTLEARFSTPNGVAVDSSGNIYVADAGNHRIRKIEYTAP